MRRILALFLVVFALVPTHHAAAAGQLQLVIEPRDSVSPLVSFINAAQHTLDGEDYLATSQPVLRALEAAAARHVTVRIISIRTPLARPHCGEACIQPARVARRAGALDEQRIRLHSRQVCRIRYDTRLDRHHELG